MNMKQISEIAIQYGIKPKYIRKAELIHLIQRNEGNFDCFATAYQGVCDQEKCLWRQDCLKQAVKKSH
ncbi:SAP domain-containing protein [Neptunicella marina]|uniref:SAP domain-containing protein n=1 Tax=Neptunicella marina TaxID=2125989 RepID=A0A8J6IRV8_9ALTE|nr:SAP domain-containing protein [Neptunicella marina]MBC3764463.1 SAP domain-containing protein [Neptunicella marina]